MQSIPAIPARTRSLAFAVCLLFSGILQIHSAAPPGNDTCAGAMEIPSNGPFPYLTSVIQDVRSATTNGDPGEVECLVDEARSNLTRSVWYKFTPPAGPAKRYTITTGPDAGSTVDDTVMAIYTAPSGCSGPFVSDACNDDAGGEHRWAGISKTLVGGTTYYIVVWVGEGATELTETNSAIQLRIYIPAAITNDACSGAQIIPASATFPYLTAVTDNTLATNNLVPTCAPQAQDGVPSRDLWYEFTPPSTGTYIVSTGADTATTVIDTLLAIYSSPSPCGTLTSVVCNNNNSGRAVVAQALTAGTRYYIVVWDNDSEPIPGSTLVQLRISRAAAPSVATLTASSISSTGALLKGTVNPNGLQSRYWFEWGPTTGLGSTSQVRLLLGGTTTVAAESAFTTPSLTANTPYYFQIVSTNSMGTSRGQVLTFVWSDTQPDLSTPVRSGSSYKVQFSNGNPGQLYMIQGATDLGAQSPWTDLGVATNIISTTIFQFTHLGATAAPYRFYRARLP